MVYKQIHQRNFSFPPRDTSGDSLYGRGSYDARTREQRERALDAQIERTVAQLQRLQAGQ